MVGLLIITRHKKLAEAIAQTVADISPVIPVSYTGGTNDPEHIKVKLQSIYSQDGVLVLTDDHKLLKIISEAAVGIDADNIMICPAPLAEGAAVAAEMIVNGADLHQIYYYATHALAHKLASPDISVRPEGNGVSTSSPDGKYTSYRFQMMLPNGLHATAASELVRTITPFKAYVAISNISSHKPPVNARSLNKIALTTIKYGEEVEILASGPEASEVLEAVQTLVLNNFNKNIINVPESDFMKNTVLSVGLASGILFHAESIPAVQPLCVLEPENEVRRFQTAIEKTKASLESAKERFISQGLHEEALIFDAHTMILEDTELLTRVCKDIRNTRLNAAYAYQQQMLGLADEFRNINDIYMRERSTDILDVARQVIAELTGKEEIDISTLNSIIIASHEVTPSMLSKCRPGQLKGIITYKGSVFSHVAILARALGIPAIAGYKIPSSAATGDTILLNATKAEVIINPSQDKLFQFNDSYIQWHNQLARNLEDGKDFANTPDGFNIPIYGNVGDIPTSESVIQNGAEGIGLLRTEFLYLNRRNKPSEKEQIQVLKDIFSMFANKPIYVRTLDIGGDKHIPWLPLKKENNPFLGVRGVRIYTKEKELFMGQLKAILTAGYDYDVKIVIPMISTVNELITVKEMLEKAHYILEEKGTAHLWPVPVGVMIETPSAVFMANELAQHADFFSIGTNDLCQYIMAAERGEATTEHLLNPLQPALLRAIKQIITTAHDHGIEVCVCGEMASDSDYAKVLLGLGVDSLSMNASSIGSVKRTIRKTSLADMQYIAEKAMAAQAPVPKQDNSKVY